MYKQIPNILALPLETMCSVHSAVARMLLKSYLGLALMIFPPMVLNVDK